MQPEEAVRRRTKIVATLGPATDSPEVIEQLLLAGVNVVRLNFSHGNIDDHQRRVDTVRSAARRLGRHIGVLGDLQGPKIRIRRFAEGPIHLDTGDEFALDANLGKKAGNRHEVGITYAPLADDVEKDDILLLNDGQISLRVREVTGRRVECVVVQGGTLSDSKGINRQGGGLSATALTDKDKEDITHAAAMGVDYLALSFPRDGNDVREARRLLREAGGQGFIVAKIERAEAVTNMDDILRASDVVMVARGDLGVEIGDAELPGVQKRLIQRARHFSRVTITATQMMESMISSPIPTRAEVLDVANAVIDGSDAVMLSAETAAGKYPVKAVEAMDRVCRGAERQQNIEKTSQRVDRDFELTDEAIAMATMFTANHMNVKAIVALTESGNTALWLSRVRSGKPIFAFTPNPATCSRVTLYRGVYPIDFVLIQDEAALVERVVSELLSHGVVDKGDRLILTRGDLTGVSGETNTLKILTV